MAENCCGTLPRAPLAGSRGPRFCRSKPSILIGTQERPHRLHHARKSKALCRTPVGNARRLCHHRDRRGLAAPTPYSRQSRFGVGPPALVLRHRASAVVETAGSPRRRLFLVLLVAPIDVALNPAAGLSHSAARLTLTGPWAGISLRAPSKEPHRRCSAAASRRRRAARPSRPDETRPGGLLGGSAAMQSSQSRRGRTVYPLNREETP